MFKRRKPQRQRFLDKPSYIGESGGHPAPALFVFRPGRQGDSSFGRQGETGGRFFCLAISIIFQPFPLQDRGTVLLS